MAFTINTNISSLQAQEYLRTTGDFQSKTINRVTSGLRIIDSGDDAAGLAIANGYRSDAAVLTQGLRNANDGIATLQTIDGGISNIGKLIDRARTLAAQSAPDTFTGDRTVLNNEFQNVISEINRQAQAIGMVTNGEFNRSMSVFIGGGRGITGGTTESANGSVAVDFRSTKLDAASLGLAANGVTGSNDLRASGTSLRTAVTDGTANVTEFDFRGLGFTGATPAKLIVDITGAKDAQGVVDILNTGLTSLAATNTAFAAAGIRATYDNSTGKLSFTSTAAVQVSASNAAAQALYTGAATETYSTGSYKASVAWATIAVPAAGTSSQRISIDYKDASGNVQNKYVDLSVAAGGTAMDIDAAVTALNSSLSAVNGLDVYAVKEAAGNISFVSAKGTTFQANVSDTTNSNAYTKLATGANTGDHTVINAATTGTGTAVDISSSGNAVSAVTALASAVKALGVAQANVGRAQNQLSYAVRLGTTQVTNLAASESRIRDADLASEAANLTKAQILTQAGVAALAQANSAPQAVLSLLRA